MPSPGLRSSRGTGALSVRPTRRSLSRAGSPVAWKLQQRGVSDCICRHSRQLRPPSYQSPRSSQLPPIPGLPPIPPPLFPICASSSSKLLVNLASNRWRIVCCAAIETRDNNFVAKRYLNRYCRATHLIHPFCECMISHIGTRMNLHGCVLFV